MEVLFHGVQAHTRSASSFQKYGGNTTCVETRHSAFQLILDAGTALERRNFG